MGQLWKIANLSKREKLEFKSFAKLMEWSYFGNERVEMFCELLATHWKGDEVVVVGDYTERTFENRNLYLAIRFFKTIGIKRNSNNPYKYIYNHAKREFIDLSKCRKIRHGLKIHPLPLLLAGAENGNGNGDYRGDEYNNQEFVGRWLDDVKHLELSIEPLTLDYEEFIPDFYENLV